MSSTLALIVQECAEQSVRGVLSAAVNLREAYVVRLAALRTRLAPLQTRASRVNMQTATQAEGAFVVAVSAVGAAVTATGTSVREGIGPWIRRLRQLPDLLVAAINGLSLSTSFSPTKVMVCSRVDETLQPELQEVTNALSQLRALLDPRLQEIELSLNALEKIAQKMAEVMK